MATITLDYNANSSITQKILEFILSSGLFQPRTAEYASVTEKVSRKRKKIDKIFNNYLVDLSDFKFDRDEANDYD